MKVIEIYDKNSNILDHRKNVFKAMNKYMSRFPESYSRCYRKNLETLEIIKVDRLEDGSISGIYNPAANNIFFEKNYSLGHELFHMSSNDMDNEQFAFESKLCIEDGIIEGMTEYHHMKAYDLPLPGAYSFEVFTVTMMEDIPNIFESFFVPREKGIFDICKDRKAVYGFLYSLDSYNQLMMKYVGSYYGNEDILFDTTEARRAIRHTIDNLISIELSVEKDGKKLMEYADKFMDLINSNFVGDVLPELYANYVLYADKEIKKRIRNRG